MSRFFLLAFIPFHVSSEVLRAEGLHAAPAGGPARVTLRYLSGTLEEQQRKFIDGFCEAPAATVCGKYRLGQMETKIEKVRNQLHADALGKVESVYQKQGADRVRSMVEGDVTSFVSSIGSALFPSREEAKLFLRQVETLVERELGESIDHNSFLRKELQPALEKALEAHIIRFEERSELLSRLREVLSEVEVFTPSRFLEKNGSFTSLQLFCGRQLLSYNSFFLQVDREAGPPPSIVVCPGVWIQALAAKRYEDFFSSYLRDVLTSTLSHELGHRIDYSRYPQYYDAFAQCVHRNLWEPEDPFRVSLEEFRDGPFNEMVADYWSAETLAALKETGKISTVDLIRIIIHSSAPYCDSQPHRLDPHPPGKFRIDLKGRNPRLREALGCSPRSSQEVALCGLEGMVARGDTGPKALPRGK